MYLNKAIVIGNLTRDPEMRSLPTGSKVTSFSVATNRVWKDKEGAKKEASDFHNIVVFGKQAENCAQYLKRGQSVMVEGRMQTRSWDDKTSGQKKYRMEIVADSVQFGPKADGGGRSANYNPNQSPTAAKSQNETPAKETLDTIEYPEEDINPEDIPF